MASRRDGSQDSRSAGPAGSGLHPTDLTGSRPSMLATPREIAIASLTQGASLRETPLSRDHVARLVASGGHWPPLLVHRDDLVVIDGQHRLAAAIELKLVTTAVVLHDGPPDDAFMEALQANASHGLPLTLRERRSAAFRVLAIHPEWSDRKIARTCGLSSGTTRRVRASADRSAGGPVIPITRRLGADGKYRPATPGEIRTRVAETISQRPDASLRAIAVQTGCSPATVLAVRQSTHQVRSEVSAPSIVGVDGSESTTRVPSKLWQSDSACASSESSREFAEWFDRTTLDPRESSRYLESVPLSRIYEVVDEALRRSKEWSDFAAALERFGARRR